MTHVTINSLINYLYCKQNEKTTPVQAACDFAKRLHTFSQEHGYNKQHNHEYIPFVINVMNAIAGISDMPEEYWEGIDAYFANSNIAEFICTNDRSRFISAIKKEAVKLTEEYNSFLEKTAETQQRKKDDVKLMRTNIPGNANIAEILAAATADISTALSIAQLIHSEFFCEMGTEPYDYFSNSRNQIGELIGAIIDYTHSAKKILEECENQVEEECKDSLKA